VIDTFTDNPRGAADLGGFEGSVKYLLAAHNWII
jgi:cyanate permease